MSVIIECVKEKSRLRVRIQSYQDENGKIIENVYNNTYNCQFPKKLRDIGCKYRIPVENVKLQGGNGKQFYYHISSNNAELIENTMPFTYLSSTECSICLENQSDIVFFPCGHIACCNLCSLQIQKCCICRKNILKRIHNHTILT